MGLWVGGSAHAWLECSNCVPSRHEPQDTRRFMRRHPGLPLTYSVIGVQSRVHRLWEDDMKTLVLTIAMVLLVFPLRAQQAETKENAPQAPPQPAAQNPNAQDS